jgi:peptidoglycan/LPS O-acetylase OafA/YrhL
MLDAKAGFIDSTQRKRTNKFFMIETKYRPEVDGLRAVAVSIVVLYHAGLGFSGGFVGVDVFFVISGFLITGLILKDLEANRFTLANFWLRRIKRIIPAAAAMTLAVLLVGYLLLIPKDYTELGKTVIAQQAMLSNVFFWMKTNYFDGPAEIKPLLHTWSLAVEEQFYLFFPFLLVLLHSYFKRSIVIVLSTIAFLSFALSVYGLTDSPSATFFLLPFRAWELLMGSLICFLPRPNVIGEKFQSLLSLISIGAIIAVGCLYTVNTPFPGASALAPCLAAAAFIYINSIRLSWPAAILASKPVVFIGLISYSLYLWHWPVLVYLRYWFGEIEPAIGIFAVALSLLLAFLSWKFIETPFRKKASSEKAWMAYAGAVVSAALLVIPSTGIWLSKGVPGRFNAGLNQIMSMPTDIPQEYKSDTSSIVSDKIPFIGPKQLPGEKLDFVVWGDSHALASARLFGQLSSTSGASGAVIARPAFPPVSGVFKPSTGHEMIDWNQEALKFIERHNARNVFILARWTILISAQENGRTDNCLVDDSSPLANPAHSEVLLERGLTETLAKLDAMKTRVWLVRQVPFQAMDPMRSIVLESTWLNREAKGVALSEHSEYQSRANAIIDKVVAKFQNVTLIDPQETCFTSDRFSRLGDSQGCFYADDDHLSPYGAEALESSLFEPIFRLHIKEKPQAVFGMAQ